MSAAPATDARTVTSVGALREAVAAARRDERRIVFVPTMGALHEGHASLVRAAAADGAFVVVSCYVNPRQFGEAADLERYPRTPERDAAVVAAAGGSLLWRPADDDVYGTGAAGGTVLGAGVLGTVLEGAARPGHFDGVVQVVARLLGAVQPDVLVLGEKDFQQLAILRRLVADLLLPIAVIGAPTVRDADGLALSSRNVHLSPAERVAAAAIPQALDAAIDRYGAGERSIVAVLEAARHVLAQAPLVDVDYLVAVDRETLAPALTADERTQLLVAARVGTTRLIDNARLTPEGAA